MKINNPVNKSKIEVSVIVPCYNEEKTISFLLDAIYQQTYPISLLEVIIADAISIDRTRENINSFSKRNRDLRVKIIDNPFRTIPAAINLAVKATSGQFIVRLDAHSIPNNTYIQKCINALKQGLAECVGGVWDIVPGGKDWIARSIAAAAAHPIAVGDAQYRFTRKSAYVDTVPFGAFRKELFQRIGGFNEKLLTNEDYEFFTRIRKNNGRIWLDPAIRCTYFARKNLWALIQQYWRYGFWKYRMLMTYPETLRWRQALPPLFTLAIILLIILTLFYRNSLFILGGLFFPYLVILIVSSSIIALKKKEPTFIIGMPLAMICMHFSWGIGFLYSIINFWLNKERI